MDDSNIVTLCHVVCNVMVHAYDAIIIMYVMLYYGMSCYFVVGYVNSIYFMLWHMKSCRPCNFLL